MTDPLALIEEHQPDIDKELKHLNELYDAYHGEVTQPHIPPSATAEFKTLLDRSKINVLPLIVSAASQSLHIEDYRSRQTQAQDTGSRIFEQNAMGSRQAALFDACLIFGYAYTSVLKSSDGKLPYIGTHSPRRMYSVFENPGEDEFPEYAFTLNASGQVVIVWDDLYRYHIKWTKNPNTLKREPRVSSVEEHGTGVCPVKRHAIKLDLEGRAVGEIEPQIKHQIRLNQIAFDTLIAISYNSFKIRGFTGLAPQLDDDGNPVPINADAARLFLIADEDTKPFQLDGTPLEGYLASADQTIKQIATTSQTPLHFFHGVTNMSADGFAAAESGLMRKLNQYKHTLGESMESFLRLAIAVAGDTDSPDSEVIWADSEARALSNISDALVKLSAGLDIPAEGLWHRIPNVTQGEIEEWKTLRRDQEQRAIEGLSDELKMQLPDGDTVMADGSSATDDR